MVDTDPVELATDDLETGRRIALGALLQRFHGGVDSSRAVRDAGDHQPHLHTSQRRE